MWEAKTLSVEASDTFHFLIHAAKLVSEDRTIYWDFVGFVEWVAERRMIEAGSKPEGSTEDRLVGEEC